MFSSPFIESTTRLNRYRWWQDHQAKLFPSPQYFLSSFPRSANGWVRVILAAILATAKGLEIESAKLIQKTNDKGVQFDCLVFADGHQFDVEDVLPDMYVCSSAPDERSRKIAQVAKQLKLPFTIVKTHHLVDCNPQKTIFLFREPLACLTSTSLLLNRAGINEAPASINQTIVYFSDYYLTVLKHYLDQKDANVENCFFLSHELLSSDSPGIQYQQLMRFLGVEVELSLIEKVLRKLPLRSKYNKARIKSITDETREIITEKFSSSYAEAMKYASDPINRKSCLSNFGYQDA